MTTVIPSTPDLMGLVLHLFASYSGSYVPLLTTP
jgi:hypothetical protein